MSSPSENRIPWHAGIYNTGYVPLPAPITASPALDDATATGAAVLLADVSEFQPDIADAAYLNWSKAIIIRAAYGDAHDDSAWYGGARRADLHKGGVRFLGIYQYIVSSQDAVQQADVLATLVGKLQPGERIIGDLEEGAGNQDGRWLAWSSEIEKLLGQKPWSYSGLNFAADHGIAPVDWVADYSPAEPGVRHTLWQFTDSFTIPGVGASDCSLFHGTIDELAALGYQDITSATQPSHVIAKPNWTSIELTWSGTCPPGGYTVYLVSGSTPDGEELEKVELPPSATGYRFGHLKFSHDYTVGVWAKPGQPGAEPAWRTVKTK